MARRKATGPTDRELSILQVLWTQGSSTVREVHQGLDQDIAYTTVLSMLQVMLDKGLVVRDESTYPQHYAASTSQERMQESMTRDFIDKVFAGSSLQLVQRALSTSPASQEELDYLEGLIKARKGDDSGDT